MGDEQVVLIKGKLSSKQLDMLSELVYSFGGIEMAAGTSIVEVGVTVSEQSGARIVRTPVNKFFDFVRWDMFTPAAQQADV